MPAIVMGAGDSGFFACSLANRRARTIALSVCKDQIQDGLLKQLRKFFDIGYSVYFRISSKMRGAREVDQRPNCLFADQCFIFREQKGEIAVQNSFLVVVE